MPAEPSPSVTSGAHPSPLAVGVLVSGRGSNLQAILDAIERGELAARVAVVVSNRPGVLALTRAEQRGIPTAVHERRDFPSRRARDQAILHTIRAHDVQLVVNAGYSAILHRSVVAAYRDRIINIHPSLLPAFAGGMAPKPQADALAAGVKIAGCTVHIVTEDVDAGPDYRPSSRPGPRRRHDRHPRRPHPRRRAPPPPGRDRLVCGRAFAGGSRPRTRRPTRNRCCLRPLTGVGTG